MWEPLPCGDPGVLCCPKLSPRGNGSHIQQPMKSDAHSRNLRIHRKNTEPGSFFVTKCLLPRKPMLISTQTADLIIDTLAFSIGKERIVLAAFVVMPDHWHALLCVLPPLTLPKTMHRIDSWIGRESHTALVAAMTGWETGFYETHIKTWRQFRYVCSYIEENPIRKGLTEIGRASCRERV